MTARIRARLPRLQEHVSPEGAAAILSMAIVLLVAGVVLAVIVATR